MAELDLLAHRICSRVMQLLREEREQRGVSGSLLAERCGLNQSTISLLDRAERKPTLDTLVRISTVLEVDLGEIVNRATAEVRAVE